MRWLGLLVVLLVGLVVFGLDQGAIPVAAVWFWIGVVTGSIITNVIWWIHP